MSPMSPSRFCRNFVFSALLMTPQTSMGNFKMIFFTKGSFVKDPKIRYEGGNVFAVTGQDPDIWSYFEAIDLVKGITPDFDASKVRMWWKHDGGSFEVDLKPFRDDGDAVELGVYAYANDVDVEIYSEEKPETGEATFMEKVIDKGKGRKRDEVEYESSDESVKDVHFEDSEEERMKESDDGIEVEDDGVDEGIHGGDDGQAEGGDDGQAEGTDDGQASEKPDNIFITDEMGKEHVIDEEYLTDELDSGADDDSCDDRPTTIRFKEDDGLSKNFKFKVGMEFSSLKQFKKVVLEHNVLNGREVKFEKNDADRCRVVCNEKKICNYTVLCSRVLKTTTFRIKTLFHKHKCGRHFFNKSAKAEWVAKVIVDGLKNNTKMKLNEVVADVRLKYATEIPGCRAFKARQLARRIVEGDSSKQYSLLWSYGAELRRASSGNTFKLNTMTPAPGLQPRFERCYMCFDGCKKALIKACRPFIGLDGCHLKNKYGGILLIAVGRDPNDQYLPIAFAVVETESKDTWSWFMKLLIEDIGEQSWCFISDQQKASVFYYVFYYCDQCFIHVFYFVQCFILVVF
ncbi:uncharacterized protein LOC131596316 [Vicia villosa]|uniref:uncharacterized protein LOC131596316 n=1 Tax=Vicia villosa TaxID=3911 RepID=UPI00273ADC21|nr:uncharacterized protein LOC131596316 [Vicia villosa]